MGEIIKAIHDNNLITLLNSLGYSSRFNAGKLKCAYCKEKITEGNLHAIIPDGSNIAFSCSNSECVISLMAVLQERTND